MNPNPEGQQGPLISRAELLGGLAGRRVSSALYAIESRTAYLSLKARNATAPALAEGVLEEQERAFLSALAAGRDLPVSPTIQEIEQFAPQWAFLVPSDAVGRAELAQRLGDKYRFRVTDVARMRAALGLDDPAVQRAYRDRHGAQLEEVYDTDLTVRERLRWTRSRLLRRLEELPPFWTTYGLTVTETAGAGLLALPIAMGGLGPLPGVAILVILGLLNVLTIVAVAETFTRTSSVRWSGAFFGRVVLGYLGRTGGLAFSIGLVAFTVPVLLACYVGFAVTVGTTTGTSAPVWAALLFAADVALILRKGLNATVASALIVGAVNIVSVLVLVVLALTAFNRDNATYAAVPFIGGRPFDASLLDLAFGVVLLSYYGHTSVGNAAQVVLRREPGGRSLMAGSVAATCTAIALYSLWVFAIGSAVPPGRLASEAGTALVPLVEVVGPAARIIGFVFVFLAVGMGSVHLSLSLYNLVAERFVTRRRLGTGLGFALVASIFLVAEVLLVTGKASFAGSLGIIGALAGPLMAGVFPILMVLSSRRRGDCVPVWFWRWMGRPVVAALIYAVFLATLVVYVFVWPSLLQRLTALAVALVVVAITVVMLRSGALRPRAVVEVRRDAESGRDHLEVVASGRSVRSEALPFGTRRVEVDLEPLPVHELQAWSHLVDPGGGSEPLAVTASLLGADRPAPPQAQDGAVVFTVDGQDKTLELALPPFSLGRRR